MIGEHAEVGDRVGKRGWEGGKIFAVEGLAIRRSLRKSKSTEPLQPLGLFLRRDGGTFLVLFENLAGCVESSDTHFVLIPRRSPLT